MNCALNYWSYWYHAVLQIQLQKVCSVRTGVGFLFMLENVKWHWWWNAQVLVACKPRFNEVVFAEACSTNKDVWFDVQHELCTYLGWSLSELSSMINNVKVIV